MSKVDVSIILTGYNEGKSLEGNLDYIVNFLKGTRYKWEIILYDDASKDNTRSTFRACAKKNKNVKFYFNKKNVGRGGTVKKAIKIAKGKYVGYIDTDLELPPIYLTEFINSLDGGADLAIAKRVYAVGVSNFIRAILSRGYVFCVHMMLGIKLEDTEAGFKFFDRKKILKILDKVVDDRWFFDTEIVTRSYWAGLKIAEVPVLYVYDSSKASSVNLVSDSLDYFKKLWRFRQSTIEERH